MSPSITVRLLTADIEFDYSEFLKSVPHALLYHSLKYRDFLLSAIPASTPIYLVAQSRGEICGVFPLIAKSGSNGTVINSLPYYGSHGGMLARPSFDEKITLYKMFMETTFEICKKKNARALTIIENPFDPDNHIHSSYKHNHIDSRIGQYIQLIPNAREEDLILTFHSKTRNVVRKAQRENFSIGINNNRDAWDFLIETHIENMREIGGIAKSLQAFRSIETIFSPSKDYDIWIATKNGVPAAALLVLYYGDTVEYFTPCVAKIFRSSQPLSLLILEAMKTSISRGYRVWNWGGTWLTQDGVHLFKKRWGTQEKIYHYYNWVFDTDLYKMDRRSLLHEFANFYVLPFSELKL